MIKTLAIETSCDDTSLAIVCFDGNVFSVENMVCYSQISQHIPYGGVVPELASRLHSEQIISLIEQIGMDQISEVDFISLTSNPGLPGSLIVGITAGYFLGELLGKQIVEVNHIDGHLFSVFLQRNLEDFKFPAVFLTASGGHNEIYLVQKEQDFIFQKLGQSLDDAAGESFDKVARMLGGSYPGGPRISQKALSGKFNELVKFSPSFLKADEFNFSFSGMKSQVYYLLQDLKKKGIELDEQLVADISLAFETAVCEVLSNKLVKAAKLYDAQMIAIVGGVSANDRLWEQVQMLQSKKLKQEISVLRPISKKYCMDNAGMIGVAGIVKYLSSNKKDV